MVDIFVVRSRLLLMGVLSYWERIKTKVPVTRIMWCAKKSTIWVGEEEALGSSPLLHVNANISLGKDKILRCGFPMWSRPVTRPVSPLQMPQDTKWRVT